MNRTKRLTQVLRDLDETAVTLRNAKFAFDNVGNTVVGGFRRDDMSCATKRGTPH